MSRSSRNWQEVLYNEETPDLDTAIGESTESDIGSEESIFSIEEEQNFRIEDIPRARNNNQNIAAAPQLNNKQQFAANSCI